MTQTAALVQTARETRENAFDFGVGATDLRCVPWQSLVLRDVCAASERQSRRYWERQSRYCCPCSSRQPAATTT
eukprot:1146761-Rhodomonas_salina.1